MEAILVSLVDYKASASVPAFCILFSTVARMILLKKNFKNHIMSLLGQNPLMVSHLNKIQCPFSGIEEASHDQAPYSLKSHLPLPSPMVFTLNQSWPPSNMADTDFELILPSAYNDVSLSPPQGTLTTCSLTSFSSFTERHHPVSHFLATLKLQHYPHTHTHTSSSCPPFLLYFFSSWDSSFSYLLILY